MHNNVNLIPYMFVHAACACAGISDAINRTKLEDRRNWNYRQPLYMLPGEVLSSIFAYCEFGRVIDIDNPMSADAAWSRAQLLAASLTVCHHFFTTLLAFSAHWNVLIATPYGRPNDANILRKMIQRSGTLPIQLVWDCHGRRRIHSNDCVHAVLSLYGARIRSLTIRHSSRAASLTAGVLSSRGQLESLRAIRFECEPLYGLYDTVPIVPSGDWMASLSRTVRHGLQSVYSERRAIASVFLGPQSVPIGIPLFSSIVWEFSSRCRALHTFEWVVPIRGPGSYGCHDPILFLPAVETVVISHPTLMGDLHPLVQSHDDEEDGDDEKHDETLKNHRLKRDDEENNHTAPIQRDEDEVTDGDEETPHTLRIKLDDGEQETIRTHRLKRLRLSCPCIGTNELLNAILELEPELEELNLGTQKNRPDTIIHFLDNIQHIHAPRIRKITFGIWPDRRFHPMWHDVITPLAQLLTRHRDVCLHCVFVKEAIPECVKNLLDRHSDSVVQHNVRDIHSLQKAIKKL
jgi:hypothetical protein